MRSFSVPAVWVLSIVVAYCLAYAAVSWLLGFRFDGTEIPPFQHVRGIRTEVREVTMKVSKEMSAQTQIEALWWQVYRGGSYNGFEEVGFTFAGTLVLTPFLALFTPRLKAVRRRLPRSSPMRKAI